MWSEAGVMRSLKYEVLNENKLDPSFFPNIKYITLRHNSGPHQILYLEAFNWHLEIRCLALRRLAARSQGTFASVAARFGILISQKTINLLSRTQGNFETNPQQQRPSVRPWCWLSFMGVREIMTSVSTDKLRRYVLDSGCRTVNLCGQSRTQTSSKNSLVSYDPRRRESHPAQDQAKGKRKTERGERLWGSESLEQQRVRDTKSKD